MGKHPDEFQRLADLAARAAERTSDPACRRSMEIVALGYERLAATARKYRHATPPGTEAGTASRRRR
jgi:hypothetical protein